ncbi:hypothetical protein PR048_019698 [Dryococelus australis]|uniref:Uncharacterized protein n=1 Tax=Dryococelus australis TaxID=614101 RepID=A0ABQ9H467_9NEOP|nr:hypothetical protein PR048_019698 [Dryococelus australis]
MCSNNVSGNKAASSESSEKIAASRTARKTTSWENVDECRYKHPVDRVRNGRKDAVSVDRASKAPATLSNFSLQLQLTIKLEDETRLQVKYASTQVYEDVYVSHTCSKCAAILRSKCISSALPLTSKTKLMATSVPSSLSIQTTNTSPAVVLSSLPHFALALGQMASAKTAGRWIAAAFIVSIFLRLLSASSADGGGGAVTSASIATVNHSRASQKLRGMQQGNERVVPLRWGGLRGQQPGANCSAGAGVKGRGKREIPEKTRRPAASSGTIRTCENPVIRPGIKPGSPWWQASLWQTHHPELVPFQEKKYRLLQGAHTSYRRQGVLELRRRSSLRSYAHCRIHVTGSCVGDGITERARNPEIYSEIVSLTDRALFYYHLEVLTCIRKDASSIPPYYAVGVYTHIKEMRHQFSPRPSHVLRIKWWDMRKVGISSYRLEYFHYGKGGGGSTAYLCSEKTPEVGERVLRYLDQNTFQEGNS